MTKQELQKHLQFIEENSVGLELYFLYKDFNVENLSLLRANLEGSEAKTKLEKVFIKKIINDFSPLQKKIEGKENDIDESQNNDFSLKYIKDVDQSKNTIYYFPNVPSINDEYHIPPEFEQMEILKNTEYENILLFDHEKHSLNFVIAYMIRLQIDSEQIIIFKHKNAFDILTRSTILKMLSFDIKKHSTKFSLEKEPLVKITDSIDFMYVDSNFIIVNLGLLESKYSFNERYLKRAGQALNIIRNKNILDGIEILEKMIKNIGFAKKIMKIENTNEVLKAPVSKINDFLNQYKTADGKFTLAKRINFNPKKNKFEIKTKVAGDDFIKLLNDQFLQSNLTDKSYISELKSVFEIIDDTKTVKRNKVTKSPSNKIAKLSNAD